MLSIFFFSFHIILSILNIAQYAIKYLFTYYSLYNIILKNYVKNIFIAINLIILLIYIHLYKIILYNIIL